MSKNGGREDERICLSQDFFCFCLVLTTKTHANCSQPLNRAAQKIEKRTNLRASLHLARLLNSNHSPQEEICYTMYFSWATHILYDNID